MASAALSVDELRALVERDPSIVARIEWSAIALLGPEVAAVVEAARCARLAEVVRRAFERLGQRPKY